MKRLSAAITAVVLGIALLPSTGASAKAVCAAGDRGGEWRSFGSDLSNSRAQFE